MNKEIAYSVIKRSAIILILLAALYSCRDDDDDKDELTDLSGYFISSLSIDNSGILWVGSDSGLYRSENDGFLAVDIKIGYPVTALCYEKTNNTLWVGTENGLSVLSLTGSSSGTDTVPASKLSDSFINAVYVDEDSRRWFGTGIGITMNQSETWQKDKFKKNLSGTIGNLAFSNLAINSIGSYDGSYYFATRGLKMYRTFNWDESVSAFSGATQWISPYNGSALTDTMNVVFIDSQDRQWFGGTQGLQVHTGNDPKTGNTAYVEELINPVVNCIAESPDGNIWVGTDAGISVFNGSSWDNPTLELPDLKINAIAIDQATGKKYIGTGKGLAIITE